MKQSIPRPHIVILFSYLLCLYFKTSAITLPTFFADNMVLQRNSNTTIWGWGRVNEEVKFSASWEAEEKSTSVNDKGYWEISIITPDAGGPFKINISGDNNILLKNILVGEVWFCSGQSNMELTANYGINDAETEIQKANYPNIRLFTVARDSSLIKKENVKGTWEACSPETMAEFSAIAYFFGKKLYESLDVPIGLINSTWGGTPAETWMPEEVIEGDPFLKEGAYKLPSTPWGPHLPARLYNAMIVPFKTFKIAGVIWYQGESNTENPTYYETMFRSLISSWRKQWKSKFPFYYAQIAPFPYGKAEIGVQIRDAQRRVLSEPGTGMVITSDIGDTTDIHPRNKRDVGVRFANLALNKYYQTTKELIAGPELYSYEIIKKKVYLLFGNADGLRFNGKATGFEIAAADMIYYPAEATIKDDMVIVYSKMVSDPKSVRYEWSNTAQPTLINKSGIPSSSFRIEF